MTCFSDEADEHRLALCLMKSNPAKICVPVCVQRASALAAATERAAEWGDIVEFRFDCFDDEQLNAAMRYLPSVMSGLHRPSIFTFRSAEQGGGRDLTFYDYQNHSGVAVGLDWCWISHEGRSFEPDFADWEVDLVIGNERIEKLLGIARKWDRIICSHHDFVGVPADLDQIYERMAATPARILKIAVQADDATDCLPIFRLLERAKREGREMIAIAMGAAGLMTRILGPSRGSFLTYGSLDDESATAPGQVNARELRELYRIDQINQQTEIVGVIGSPVGHSLSPQIHNAAFADAGLNAVYLPFEVRDAGQFMRHMIHPRSRELEWNLRGLSVTAPHKSGVMNFLNWIEPAAKEMGAVNTVRVREDELHGYNTDAEAFVAPLRRKFGSVRDARCAIIGAGGAARAALWALRNEGVYVALFVRDPEKARPVSEEFKTDLHSVAGASFAGFDIVVNATPVGTRGVSEPDTVATAEQLRGVRLAYDLVYNPLETRFLREAHAAGCETLGGIEMLLAQAVEQFKIWIGKDPDVEVMRAAALRALGNS